MKFLDPAPAIPDRRIIAAGIANKDVAIVTLTPPLRWLPKLACPSKLTSKFQTPMQLVSSMTDPDENEPYRVEAAHGAFQIVDAAGGVILGCADEASAVQYAALLKQVYRRGYKAGYRKARSLPRS